MLQFIFGRAGFGKTSKIRELILEAINNNTENLMLMVPEQSSFDTEKAMLDFMGPKVACKIQVVSFTRLVDLVSRKLGGRTDVSINKGDRKLLMSLAIDEVIDKLEIYSGQANKIEFVDIMVSALSEFKMCNITGSTLFNVLGKINDPILKGKIRETALILESYKALLHNTYIDPLDDLTRLYEKLLQHDFFNGYTVMIDGFEGFTMQQLSVLEMILKQSEKCYITLCTDREAFSGDKFNLFEPINRTARRILDIAKKNYIKIKAPIYLDTPKRFTGEGLKKLESQAFRLKKEKLPQIVDDVFIFNANTQYDEADFVSRTIKRLVYENGYKYGDFAVITRNDEVYKGIMDISFEKYNIPYFMDRREDIDTKPLMQLILSVLEIINNNYSSDSIFRYLKTGVAGINIDDISVFENYILFWNINGKRWLEDFTANPDGYKDIKDDSINKLFKINELRKKIINPIKDLQDKIKNATGDTITRALYEFLENINIIENLKELYSRLNNINQQSLADEQVRLWDLLINIFDRMVIILKNQRISLKRYTELLKLVINSNDIAFIPRGIDEVIFGSIDRIRIQDVKIVFLIGAVEGEFPRIPASTGIFNDAQRRQLINMGLPLYDSVEGLSINERFLAYKTMTLPSDKLYITWSCSTTLGGIKTPSSIIKEAKFILPKLTCMDEYSLCLDDEIWAAKPTFELCAKHWNDNSRFSQTLKNYFYMYDDCKEKLHSINRAVSKLPFKIKDNEKSKNLFGENLKISASQVEKYYLCKFSYFCKYGLLAKERKKAKFDALEYGNLIHFIFEQILKKYAVSQLLKFSKKELTFVIRNILDDYVKINLKGWTDKTERFKYLFKRVINTSVPLVSHMIEELSQSEFSPVDFELELSKKGAVNPLKLMLPDGLSVIVEGKIDRVDVMKKDGTSYIRVIDYKTGAKEFNLSDVLYGLNLQMIIYLEALWQNADKRYGQVIPSGILYLPSVSTTVNVDRDEDLKKIENEKMKKLRMNGLILDDPQVIFGMEHDANGIFIPVIMKDGKPKNNDHIASVAQMGAIMKHVDNLIISMAKELKSGFINAEPVKGEYDACEFCEYKTVCVTAKDENSKEVKKFNKDEFFYELNQKEGENNV